MYCIIQNNALPLQSDRITNGTERHEFMIENIKTQMRKGILEYCILAVLYNNQEAYVSDILATLKEANLFVVEGTIYPLLMRLKNSGLLSYRWQESTEGPPRKYYRLTQQGIDIYASLQQEWSSIKTSVEIVTNNKE